MKKIYSLLMLLALSMPSFWAQTPVTEQTAPQTTEQEETPAKKPSAAQRFYNLSGYSSVSLLSVGYGTVFLLPDNPNGYDMIEFTGRHHYLNASLIAFRIRFIGMEPLNFEFGVNTPGATKNGVNLPVIGRGGETPETISYATLKTMWFAYKPALKFYIPLASWVALNLYGGAEVDITGLWSKVMPKYYEADPAVPEQNYFLGAFGGLGFHLAGKVAIPVDIKFEYRHPIKGNTALVPQGFYLSAQFNIGWKLDEKGRVAHK